MAQGEILWFDAERGFGFIRPDMGPRDVFMHASALVTPDAQGPGAQRPDTQALVPGAKVEFELLQTGDGRLTAQRVIPLPPERPRRAARR